MTPLPWPPAEPRLLVALVAMAAAFALFHYPLRAAAWRARGLSVEGAVHAQRLAGAVVLGAAALLMPGDVGLGAGDPMRALLAALGLAAVALPTVGLASRRADFVEHYPQIHAPGWTGGRAARNAASWALYLVGYELFFRGALVIGLAAVVGPWTAIGLSTLAYVLAHIHKPGRETAGTVPMGVLFAAATLWCGSIWGAVAAHWLIANTSDLLAARQLNRRDAARTDGPASGR